MPKKMIILGLDCADPGLVLEKWTDRLPAIKSLMQQGVWAKLRSTDPPITVPAWTAMTTGRDPGELGIYGFRNRSDHGYDSLVIADATWVREPRIWDRLGDHGMRSIVIGVPQTYPPQPLNGIMVSGFMAPSKDHPFVYPASFRETLDRVAPEYLPDVENFRTADREQLIGQIYRMTAERFKLVRHCIREEEWDLLMMVEIGLDRLQHAFWAYMDPQSPFYQPGHRSAGVILDYYRYLDDEIGKIIDMTGRDIFLMIVSDHGAKAFQGGFCVNEWLIRNGYLKVKRHPRSPEPLVPENVVWPETKVWGEGGYYARLNLNIKGREPQGAVEPADADGLIAELKQHLQSVADGSVKIENQIHLPADLYRGAKNIPPDLMVYPDNLNFRSIGGIGYDRLFAAGNDSGPDHANHDFHGIFILRAQDFPPPEKAVISIYDIAPMVLGYMGKG